jgi:methionine-rich copper-binding protein CopC
MRGGGGLRRAVVVVLLAAAAMVGAAGPAFAHSQLVESNPADGVSLDAGPSQVALTFNEDMPPGFDVVTVIGPDGKAWQDGQVATSGPIVSVPVAPLGPAGRYQIGYRVVSGDGHPVEGSTSFVLTKAGTGSPPAQPAPTAGAGEPTDDGGSPIWPWIAAAAVAVAAATFLALRLGRS